jgi:hypothetical protein
MVLLLTLPLLLVVGLVLDVFVLRVGAQVLGARKPALLICVAAAFLGIVAGVMGQVVLGCTVGWVVSWFGSGASLLFSVMVATTAQALVYSVLLDLDGVRSALLSLASTAAGWVLLGLYGFVFGMGALAATPWL